LILAVVPGAPLQPESAYYSPKYNQIAKKRIDPAKCQPATWDAVYKTNLPVSALPKYLPKGASTHMFGPEWPLSETPRRSIPGSACPDGR